MMVKHCAVLCAGNEKLDGEVIDTMTERGADDSAAALNKKPESTGPPARPQPPVSLTVLSDI